jgi:hypothetical protein
MLVCMLAFMAMPQASCFEGLRTWDEIFVSFIPYRSLYRFVTIQEDTPVRGEFSPGRIGLIILSGGNPRRESLVGWI